MTRLLVPPQQALDELFQGEAGRAETIACSTAADDDGSLTLDELITGVWEGLSVTDTVRCPACGGAMQSCSAARLGVTRSTCSDCGSSLC